jgi:hypothetical protein
MRHTSKSIPANQASDLTSDSPLTKPAGKPRLLLI